jgi:hypothetical protein
MGMMINDGNMQPVRITHRAQLRSDHKYLVGTVTSGDHPIQWEVYDSWKAWVADLDIEDEDLDQMEDFYVFELSYSYSFRHRRRTI